MPRLFDSLSREELLELIRGAAFLLESPLVPDCVKSGPTGRTIRQIAAEETST